MIRLFFTVLKLFFCEIFFFFFFFSNHIIYNMKTWIQALKEWNNKKGGKYQIPKKGTAGYKEVKKIMGH